MSELVDAWIAAAPMAAHAALHAVRAALHAGMPGACEGIAYQIPVLRLRGTYGLYFAGYARHVAVYPVTPGIEAALGPAIAPYRHGKGTLRFPLDGVPVDLIRRIAEARAAELAGG